ncbi:RNA ligase family protein [Gracilibacillus sp. YIM 98692]|uniref:ATP-dependent DNA ligase n=1 Tax=Gracilibacillus sp. YIM 98692 TaxID=2663532 RepID=UPI0013D30211|nr:RNA ligase family protein [Gracilibacillus sp. YIM 98692]
MFISPMLLHKSEKPFTDENYLTELKLDGIRLILHKESSGNVRLYTRHNNEVTARFPELKDIEIPSGTTLDGELIVTGTNGKPDFEAMMKRFMSNSNSTPVSYVVFDILKYKGKSTTSLPLLDRKSILEETLSEDSSLVSKVRYIEGNGEAYYDLVEKQSLEGIVLKRKDSKYHAGKRSHSWLKVINYQYTDVLVTGYRKSKFGWLLAYPDGAYAGVMELGVTPTARKELYQYPIRKETKDYRYLAEPQPIRVKYRNKTKTGLLRLPSFMQSA